MVERTFDEDTVEDATAPYQHELVGFDTSEWLSKPDNIALSDGENVSLFERSSDGIYTGHYFFVVRGKAAKVVASEMLHHLFTEYPITAVRGLVPIKHLGSRWLTRQLGFTSVGAMDTPIGYCELFVLTRLQYQGK